MSAAAQGRNLRQQVTPALAGQAVTRTTILYAASTAAALPVGIISAIVLTRYLPPARYGELGLLTVFASFLSVLYNIGTLHGTFLWTYGSSGDGGEDLEIEGRGQLTERAQRRALGTGVLLTMIVLLIGSGLCAVFSNDIAQLVTGNPHEGNLVRLAVLAGATGSLFRLTVNVFRLERDVRAFSIGNVTRPVLVVLASVSLVVAGFGIGGALVGTVLANIVCVAGCVFVGRRSYALAFSIHDAREIAFRGLSVVIPVAALWIIHNADIYFVSHWVSATQVGIYRLASRLGSPPSYFASAFLMALSPLERTTLFAAVFDEHGRRQIQGLFITYYFLAGICAVVGFFLGAHLIVLVAPRTYAHAAPLVPLIAAGYMLYGGYIVLLRIARPEPHVRWYAITSVASVAIFVVLALSVIPTAGSIGGPIALTGAMCFGSMLVILASRNVADPVRIQYGRLARALGCAVVCCALDEMLAPSGHAEALLVVVVLFVVFMVLLVLSKAVPRSHLPILRAIIGGSLALSPKSTLISPASLPGTELPAKQAHVLTQYQSGEMPRGSLERARLVRALRRQIGLGSPRPEDADIGSYLLSSAPGTVRDRMASELVTSGVAPYELFQLDLAIKRVRRRSRSIRWPRVPRRTSSRNRPVDLSEGEQQLLRATIQQIWGPKESGLAQLPTRLQCTRALRVLERTGQIESGESTKFAIADALSRGDLSTLDRKERRLLGQLRRISAVALENMPSGAGLPAQSNARLSRLRRALTRRGKRRS